LSEYRKISQGPVTEAGELNWSTQQKKKAHIAYEVCFHVLLEKDYNHTQKKKKKFSTF
jgi:hypothetical protein